MLDSTLRAKFDKEIKLYPRKVLVEKKKGPDECFSMALELYYKSALLAGYGDVYLEINNIPECKNILENKIYNLLDSLLTEIKMFNEKCGFSFEYSDEIDKLGELNFQRMYDDAKNMVTSFEVIIRIFCKQAEFNDKR